MTITIPISDFRNNLARYLNDVVKGATVILRDDKKDQQVAKVIPVSPIDQKAYHKDFGKMLRKVAGTFTAKNHPEWATLEKVERWLRQNRLKSERKFHVYS